MYKSNDIFQKYIIPMLLIIIMVVTIFGQNDQLPYISQKVMLENNLRQRVETALGKLLNDVKFIVDVQLAVDYKTVEETKEIPETVTKQQDESPDVDVSESKVTEDTPSSSALSTPLPGFETPEALVTAGERSPEETVTEKLQAESSVITDVQSPKTVTKSSVSTIPVIKNKLVKVILEDGVTPDIINNVRQVVEIAAQIDNAKGDNVQILTASFKKDSGDDDAGAIILKNISEKVDALEQRQREAERKALLERQRKLEKRAIVRDSIKIDDLTNQIQEMKQQLQNPDLSEEEQKTKELILEDNQGKIDTLKKQLADSNQRFKDLEKGITVKNAPTNFLGSGTFWLIVILAIITLFMLIIILILLNKNRQNNKEIEWGYGSKIPLGARPPLQKQQGGKAAVPNSQVQGEQPATPSVQKKQPEKLKPEEIKEQKEELQGIRQSVISMSIGQPSGASKIIDDWLTEEESSGTENEEGAPL